MIFPGSLFGLFAASIAALIFYRACFLTRRMQSFRFIASAVFALFAFVIAAYPTWLYAAQMTEAALKRELAERGDFWKASALEELRPRMSARNSSQMIFVCGLSAIFSGLAVISLLSAKRGLGKNRGKEVRS